ncbi:MAG: zinc ribbon domain-containing protein [Deltaproteobacteria bacterium]|nr:zinc ribbon domain-containing protein [Deltaproteobacteria bacterium]MBI3386802.1 zinc ribbon domain-containing protein [Deltaproteobacteria bacterium]
MACCSACNHDSPTGSKFCPECGTALGEHCAQCGSDLPASAKFCNQCGAVAGASGVGVTHASPSAARDGPSDDGRARHASPLQDEATPASSGERRQPTVIFSDLVGSTALSTQFDPEEWREIVSRCQRATTAAVQEFGEHHAKNLGDREELRNGRDE